MQRVREEFEGWCKANMPVQDAKQMEQQFQIVTQNGLRVSHCHTFIASLPSSF
jgi:hypothetical protein